MSARALQLEEKIGMKPGTESFSDRDALIARMRLPDQKEALRNNLRLWLVENGLTLKVSAKMSPETLSKCYTIKAYLKTVRHNHNPSWDFISTDPVEPSTIEPELPEPEGDEAWEDFKGDAKPTVSAAEASANAMAQASFSAAERIKLLNEASAEAQRIVAERMAELSLSENTKRAIRAVAEAAARDEIINNTVKKIEITNAKGEVKAALGLQHMLFPDLLGAVQCRDHNGFHMNIWLTGPTGSGKTTAGKAVSKALDLPFGSDGSLDADYKVMGFRDANGNIVSTEFLRIYEGGGIYIADEIDVWAPPALLSLNAALGNGWCSTPKGLVERHPDACIIACANTWGFGATNDYVGRAKLDAATLDRFQPKIDWPYDEKMERAVAVNMAGDVGAKWHDVVLSARHAAQRQALKIIISPRATFCGIALLQKFNSFEKVANMTFLAGVKPEQKQALGLNFSQMAA